MIRLGLIGRGRWGKVYLKEIESVPDCEIGMVVEKDFVEKLDELQKMDGIIIASPAETHAEIIKYFPDKFLLVEKPLAIDVFDLAGIDNKKIMVGHTYLYNIDLWSKIRELRERSEPNHLGFTLFNIEGYNSNIDTFWELMPHPVSVALRLFGMPDHIRGYKFGGNLRQIRLNYTNGNSCLLQVSSFHPYRSRLITISSDREGIAFNDLGVQAISPIQNQIRAFIDFINGGYCISGLTFSKQVCYIISQAESLCDMTL